MIDPLLAKALEGVEPATVERYRETLIVDGIQLTSAVNRRREAIQQSEPLDRALSHVWVYGVGLGDLPRRLLEWMPSTKVVVVVLNKPLFKRVLMESWAQRDWTDNERVLVVDGAGITKAYGPLVTCPADVRLATEDCLHLRDRLSAIATGEINERMRAVRREELVATIVENKKLGDESLAKFFACVRTETYPSHWAVVASGPTLSDQYEWLRTFGGSIVAVSAALQPLLRNGITPNAVVTIDHAPEMTRYFDDLGSLPSVHRVPLIYDPATTNEVLRMWHGPRYVTTLDESGSLWAAGTVTHSAMDFAVKMGAEKVTLIGFDCCFPANQSHVSGAGIPLPVPDKWYQWSVDGYGNRVATANNMCLFRRGAEDYIAEHRDVEWYKRGRAGLPVIGASWSD